MLTAASIANGFTAELTQSRAVNISWRGIKLGRLWRVDDPGKKSKKPGRYTIVDVDYLNITRGSELWHSCRVANDMNVMVKIMRDNHPDVQSLDDELPTAETQAA